MQIRDVSLLARSGLTAEPVHVTEMNYCYVPSYSVPRVLGLQSSRTRTKCYQTKAELLRRGSQAGSYDVERALLYDYNTALSLLRRSPE